MYTNNKQKPFLLKSSRCVMNERNKFYSPFGSTFTSDTAQCARRIFRTFSFLEDLEFSSGENFTKFFTEWLFNFRQRLNKSFLGL